MTEIVLVPVAELRSLVREEVEEAVAVALKAVLADAHKQAKATGDFRTVSAAKAAEIADVTPDTVRRWIKKGYLQRRETKHGLRVDPADLDAFLLRRNDEPRPDEDARRVDGLATELLTHRKGTKKS